MDMLEKLYAAKLLVREADERREPIDQIRARARERTSERRPFKASLAAANGPAIIAEIKRASPSVGLIVRGWTRSADNWSAKSDLLRAIKESLEKAGVTLAFP